MTGHVPTTSLSHRTVEEFGNLFACAGLCSRLTPARVPEAVILAMFHAKKRRITQNRLGTGHLGL